MHGVCPLPLLLAPCSPGDVALDFVHGCGVLQGSHGLAFSKISESVCVETVFQSGCYHFWRGEMVTHLLRAFSLALFPLFGTCSVPCTILPLRKMTLCHCFSRLETLSGHSLFLQTPFWGAIRSWEHSDCQCTWALDVEIPSLVTLPWRGLLFCCLLCLPSSGGFLLGPVRVCVCGWWVCVGVCV